MAEIPIKVRLLLIFFLLFTPSLAYSQAQPPNQADEVIRLSTELVVVDTQVLTKKNGHAVGGLKREDFELYEDGIKQEITHFSQDKLPLSILLLLDISGSVRPVIKPIRDGALQAFEHLRAEDEVAVMVFATEAQLIQDFTKNRPLIVDRLERIKEVANVGSGTRLGSAIYQAAAQMKRATSPLSRRVIIVVTDNVAGMPRFSHPTEKEIAEALLESGSALCGLIVRGMLSKTLNVVEHIPSTGSLTYKRVTVDPYAEQTGGEVMNAKKAEVDVKLAELIDRLRTRYSLGYVSSNANLDGTFRKIKLKLASEVDKRAGNPVVLTRQGYYARKSDKPTTP